MQAKRYKVLSTAYPRYNYSVKNGVSISKRFNVILKDIGFYNESSRFNLPEIEEPQIIVVCEEEQAQATVDIADIELNKVNSIQEIEKNTYNDFETLIEENRVNDVCPKIVVVEFKDDKSSKISDYTKWKHNVIIVVEDEDSISSRTDYVCMTNKENLGAEICLMLERIAFRNMLPLIPVLRDLIATADFQPLTENVGMRINDVMRTFLKKDDSFVGWMNEIEHRRKSVVCLKGERYFEKYLLKKEDQFMFKSNINSEYIFKFEKDRLDKRQTEEDTSEDEIEPSTADTSEEYKERVNRERGNCRLKAIEYCKENDRMYELVGKLAEHISQTLEQEVITEYTKLPEEFKNLLTVRIENQWIKDTVADELFKLFVCTIDSKLDGDDPADEMLLVKLRYRTGVIMRGLRDIVAQLKLVQTTDHHIKLIKKESDRSINRLLGDLIGLFRRSKIPDCERPKSSEFKRLNDKIVQKLLENVREAKGCGYRYGKLHVFVEEIKDQDRKETVASEIKKILLGFNISDFIVSSSRPVQHFKQVGAKIRVTRAGNLGGFALMGEHEHMCALLSRHVVNGALEVRYTANSDDEIVIGSMIQAEAIPQEQHEKIADVHTHNTSSGQIAIKPGDSFEKVSKGSTTEIIYRRTVQKPEPHVKQLVNIEPSEKEISVGSVTETTISSPVEIKPSSISLNIPIVQSTKPQVHQSENIDQSGQEVTETTIASPIEIRTRSFSWNVLSVQSTKPQVQPSENVDQSSQTHNKNTSQFAIKPGDSYEKVSKGSTTEIIYTRTVQKPEPHVKQLVNIEPSEKEISVGSAELPNSSQGENILGEISENVPIILNEEQLESNENNSEQAETLEKLDEEIRESTNPSQNETKADSVSENILGILYEEELEFHEENSMKAETIKHSDKEAGLMSTTETTIKGPSCFIEEPSKKLNTLQPPSETTESTNPSKIENEPGSVFENVPSIFNEEHLESHDEKSEQAQTIEHSDEEAVLISTETTLTGQSILNEESLSKFKTIQIQPPENVDPTLYNDVTASSYDRGKWRAYLKCATLEPELEHITQQLYTNLPKPETKSSVAYSGKCGIVQTERTQNTTSSRTALKPGNIFEIVSKGSTTEVVCTPTVHKPEPYVKIEPSEKEISVGSVTETTISSPVEIKPSSISLNIPIVQSTKPQVHQSENIDQSGQETETNSQLENINATISTAIRQQSESLAEHTDNGCESVYPMNNAWMGTCVIISNENFPGKVKIDDKYKNALKMEFRKRLGTKKDVQDLKELYTMFGFDIVIWEDLTAAEIKKVLKEESAKRTSSDACFIFVICSHGNTRGICGIDEQIVTIDEITTFFDGKNCKALVDKPKIFFVQACLGDRADNHAPSDDMNSQLNTNDASDADPTDQTDAGMPTILIPTKSDMVVACSTHPGYVSLRDEENGTIFIQAVVDVFQKFAHEKHLLDLLTLVNNRVAQDMMKDEDGQDTKQASMFISSLRKKVYFFLRGKESNEPS